MSTWLRDFVKKLDGYIVRSVLVSVCLVLVVVISLDLVSLSSGKWMMQRTTMALGRHFNSFFIPCPGGSMTTYRWLPLGWKSHQVRDASQHQ